MDLGESDTSDNSFAAGLSSRIRRSVKRGNRRSDRISKGPTSSSKTVRGGISKGPASSSNAVRGASRRKRRTPQALKEIAKLQKSTDFLIPKLPFARLVREITFDVGNDVTRYTIVALQALQEATEMYVVQLLQDAHYLTLHRNRVTLSRGDIQLIRFLKHNIHMES